MIVVDTHVLLWLSRDDPQLGVRARRKCDDAQRRGELHVSAISFWEIALLTHRGRVEVSPSVGAWRGELLSLGLKELPVSGEIAIRASELEGLAPDPADRLITATAIIQEAALLTADRRILEWRGAVKTYDATQ